MRARCLADNNWRRSVCPSALLVLDCGAFGLSRAPLGSRGRQRDRPCHSLFVRRTGGPVVPARCSSHSLFCRTGRQAGAMGMAVSDHCGPDGGYPVVHDVAYGCLRGDDASSAIAYAARVEVESGEVPRLRPDGKGVYPTLPCRVHLGLCRVSCVRRLGESAQARLHVRDARSVIRGNRGTFAGSTFCVVHGPLHSWATIFLLSLHPSRLDSHLSGRREKRTGNPS
jgi:hypothetical protein